jgi:hypothetical protein
MLDLIKSLTEYRDSLLTVSYDPDTDRPQYSDSDAAERLDRTINILLCSKQAQAELRGQTSFTEAERAELCGLFLTATEEK